MNLHELAQALQIAPVMGRFHPLVPLCLPENLAVCNDIQTLVESLDSVETQPEQPILITQFEANLSHRFKTMEVLTCPSSHEINLHLPRRVNQAKQWLLTHRQVANRIIEDVQKRHYQTVILLLIDGLSYADVQDWPEPCEPCFIDGPSITFNRVPNGKIDPEVGFPVIVARLARQLAKSGLHHMRGFSYWDNHENDVSAKIFDSITPEKISHFDDALRQLHKMDLRGMYVQILRIGLDNLAHGSREVSQTEIKATVETIHQDLHALVDLLRQQQLHGAVYLMADHGILWKHNHDLQPIADGGREHARYLAVPQGQTFTKPQNSTLFGTAYQNFYVYHYPYYDRQIKSNDSGVHGGLSFEESIVPFIRVEVSP